MGRQVAEEEEIPLGRDVSRQQCRHSNESYGTTHRRSSQSRKTARHSKSSHEPDCRATQDQGGDHQGIRMTTRHHCPQVVCTRLV